MRCPDSRPGQLRARQAVRVPRPARSRSSQPAAAAQRASASASCRLCCWWRPASGAVSSMRVVVPRQHEPPLDDTGSTTDQAGRRQAWPGAPRCGISSARSPRPEHRERAAASAAPLSAAMLLAAARRATRRGRCRRWSARRWRCAATRVASQRPPMPASSTAQSTPASAKARNAAAVRVSKKVRSGNRSRRCEVSLELSRVDRRSTRSGSAPRPGPGGARCRARRASPCAASTDSSIAAVEPLPLVPTTRTDGNRELRVAELGRVRRGAGPARAGSVPGLPPCQAQWKKLRHRAMVSLSSLARHHHVEHAVLEQELGALEALRQRLADGLLDHPRSGEADQRAGLGDVDVAEHREAGGHAAGGRVGQHRDVGQPRVAHPRQAGRDLGHLHQRQDALLHPGAAGAGDDDQRQPAIEAALDGAGDLLPHHRAHRAAHEARTPWPRPPHGGGSISPCADQQRITAADLSWCTP